MIQNVVKKCKKDERSSETVRPRPGLRAGNEFGMTEINMG